jgi:predicted DCC family thiol-disulfide oxidoreductase YuxK
VILAVVPRPLREVLYAVVARSRRLLFAPPAGPCPVVPEKVRERFAP